ncbi:hypothetical protein SYNPS1DRAFT_14300 [Syncephalis pseudoplumigaleata]|uniref:3'(2'),5'-bisphosphate nucleotidase n=1 Tax=Syncephalis pseudoplumigaleata TaxID=1712513 RepID=A0A4P9Z1X6_9FUNG|nr:hypothetical protein SYNPS1DRAFT_14300 [Syncephalis pseudoplumigaleata]|eukprot:RKP26366.1 hypothetical protein SYNPS1DRAFT_14300 [Syncephalis pseudoplumigaleata]
MLAKERAVALEAVQKAMRVCRQVYCHLRADDTEYKSDASPVTVADYAVQAVVNTVLAEAFPDVRIVGEEDARGLRDTQQPQVAHLRERITTLANSVLESTQTTEQLLAAIDRGRYEGGARGQHWTLDPIDGTKGFVRGGQYAVCLALIEDGQVQLGVLGCPNLPSMGSGSPEDGMGERGVLFVAVRGHGAYQRAWKSTSEHPIKLAASSHTSDMADFTDARLCESWEAAHSDHGTAARIRASLGIKARPVRLDSQCKYGVVARGEADIYLRLPTRADYVEKIWDHAAGSLLVEEAGARITDADGRPLQFGHGRYLSMNRGIVVAHRDRHAAVLEAVQAQMHG